MISADTFRKLALDFDQVEEKPHFDKASFRFKGKIFATLDSRKKIVCVKLSQVDQSVYCLIKPQIAVPATGAWGRGGSTVFDMENAPKAILIEALKKAYQAVGLPKKPKSTLSVKAVEQIQTLHPDNHKKNKKISLEKYNTIKKELLKILSKSELSHLDLMERLYENVKDRFEGGVQWYGETVKMDLEARQIIERVGSRPERYRVIEK